MSKLKIFIQAAFRFQREVPVSSKPARYTTVKFVIYYLPGKRGSLLILVISGIREYPGHEMFFSG